MKKALCIILTALLCMTAFAVPVRADNTEASIILSKDGKNLISYGKGIKRREYVIPDTVEKIENNAFSDCNELSELYLPSFDVEIDRGAFGKTGGKQPKINLKLNDKIWFHAFLSANYLFWIDNEASYYEVYQKTDSGEYKLLKTVKGTRCKLSPAGPEKEYTFAVKPVEIIPAANYDKEKDGGIYPESFIAEGAMSEDIFAETDENGIYGGKEDNDVDDDGLSNSEEIELGTDPYNDDTDFDGLDDYLEVAYSTDPFNADTDGDGLPDGFEDRIDTDPLSIDTDKNGVPDGDEDFDNDGLTNLMEYKHGTWPYSEDHDYDGLSDGDEVNIYGTDPSKADTDGDGISDGGEIKLGLDPKKPATNGVPDNERIFAQTIPGNDWLFYNINTKGNPFEFSVEITAAGYAPENMDASFSGYSCVMLQNKAILGNIPEISYSEDMKIDDIKLIFDLDSLDSSVVNGYNDKYKDISEELSGIKRFNVFRFYEDENMLLPVETFHDEAAGRVYAHTGEMGTYCLIDMAAWLDSLGFEPDSKGNGDITVKAFSLTPMPADFGKISQKSKKDYDKDGLLDIEEMYLGLRGKDGKRLITVNADGSLKLPGLNKCISAIGGEKGLERFYGGEDNSVPKFLDRLRLLPLICDPTMEDSDGDGITDKTEMEIISSYG